jgi:CBS domain-containing protein
MNPKETPIRKLITRDVVTIGPEVGVDQAAERMRDEEIGSLIVKDGNKMVGIITERDIVVKVVAEYRPVTAMKVKDIMSAPLISVSPETSLYEAAKMMAAREIRRLPVMDGDTLLGIISERDLLTSAPTLIGVTRSNLGPVFD